MADAVTARHVPAAPTRQPWYKTLYIQVLIAIALGVLIGYAAPQTAKSFKWLGDAFIALIKMMIAPVIFCTIVHGISSMGDLKKVGRVGIKALVYFEVMSTFALFVGVLVGEIVRPGAGFGADPKTLDASAVAGYATAAAKESATGHILAIIPRSFFDALAGGDLLQVLLIAILTGVVVTGMGERAAPIGHVIDMAGQIFFRIIGLIVKLAPIGAFGAMAFTIGQYGVAKLGNLVGLVATFYLASVLFVLIVLGIVARIVGFSILRFIAYIKDELLIVLGTSSSETVLPQMMMKMEGLGASKSVVGLVIPTGYSFNLDGTNIYMTLATLFLAQAVGAESQLWAICDHHSRRHVDLEGRVGRDRSRVHHAGGDTRRDPEQSGAGRRHDPRARHRQVHERVPRADQPRRQRCRHGRGQRLGERARPGGAAGGAGASRGHRHRHGTRTARPLDLGHGEGRGPRDHEAVSQIATTTSTAVALDASSSSDHLGANGSRTANSASPITCDSGGRPAIDHLNSRFPAR